MDRPHRTRILLFLLILSLAALLLSSCVRVDQTIHVDETAETARYYLFQNNDANQYLQFLENFDEEKYEIVDISVSCGQYISTEDGILYSVTYRSK